MADISFDGINIDAETVRARLEEHDKANERRWPVTISDVRMRDGSEAYMIIKQGGYVTMQEPKAASLTEFHMDAEIADYVLELMRVGYDDKPSEPPIFLRNKVSFG